MRGVLSVFSLGDVHSKRRRSSREMASRSTILLGTTVPQGSGRPFTPQPPEKIKIANRTIIVVLCNFNFLLFTSHFSLGSLSKDRCSHPNIGGSFFNGDLKVIRHPHGEFFHRNSFSHQSLPQFPKFNIVRPTHFR